MSDFFSDLLANLFTTGTGTRAELHFIAAILVGIGFGVIAAKSGYEELSPGAAIVGFVLYAVAAIFFVILRSHRKRRFY